VCSSDLPDPQGAGLAAAIRAALHDAGVGAAGVDYVSAHGTGTPANDLAESRAIRAVFGERTDALPVSSIKSMIGHTMGAASALEAVACVLALQEGLIPPTMHCDDPDPECGLDVVPDVARRAALRVVVSNAMAFGGTNGVVVFGRAEGGAS
jgi:3-oxoacyl-[acyl-carrier-protein] synthase II